MQAVKDLCCSVVMMPFLFHILECQNVIVKGHSASYTYQVLPEEHLCAARFQSLAIMNIDKEVLDSVIQVIDNFAAVKTRKIDI